MRGAPPCRFRGPERQRQAENGKHAARRRCREVLSRRHSTPHAPDADARASPTAVPAATCPRGCSLCRWGLARRQAPEQPQSQSTAHPAAATVRCPAGCLVGHRESPANVCLSLSRSETAPPPPAVLLACPRRRTCTAPGHTPDNTASRVLRQPTQHVPCRAPEVPLRMRARKSRRQAAASWHKTSTPVRTETGSALPSSDCPCVHLSPQTLWPHSCM